MRGWMGGLATADFPRSEPCPVALRLPGLRSCRLLQAQRPGEFPQTVPRTCRAPGLPGLRSCRLLQAQRPGEFPQAVPRICPGTGLPGLRSCRPLQAQRPRRVPAGGAAHLTGLLAYRAYGLVGRCKRSAARRIPAGGAAHLSGHWLTGSTVL